MAFFEKIGEKITSTSKDVAKKTKEITEVTKLNSQINSEEDKIKVKYSEIGKLYYESFMAAPNEEFAGLCNAITESLNKIDSLKNTIQVIKGVKKCQSCGAEIINSAQFCNVCGSKINFAEEIPTLDLSQPKCTNCGELITGDSMFCSGCGNKIG
jgi:RNA polymerase subunit RPABC4/transcription elongation factor Spt4